MKHYTLFYVLCVMACMTSCSTYEKYKSPIVNTDSLYGESTDVSGDITNMAQTSWREFFRDEQLQALIDTGLVNNADFRIANLRVMEAEATLRAARMAYLPAVSFTPQGQLSSYDGS